MSKKVVILSPSKYSLYTLCIAELLLRNNVEIKAIVTLKLINPKRFISEFGRDGSRLLKKIWKKLFLRKKAYKESDYETIIDLMKKESIDHTSVIDINKKYGVPIVYCNNLNEETVINTLKDAKPDIVVFTGGGLIREGILENSGAGVLNCHMGVLPPYRGMDVVEWPLIERNNDQLGTTLHFMDKGVDTGDILDIEKIVPKKDETITQLRERYEPIMCRQMLRVCLGYLAGEIQRIPQKPEDGKQYFIMHPRLKWIVQQMLENI